MIKGIAPILLLTAGLVVGFLGGRTFDLGVRPDWQAIGAVGTLSVVLVALFPIYRDWARRNRREAINREHAMSMLYSLHSAISGRVSGTGSEVITEPLSEAEMQLVIELGILVGQIEQLKREELRTLITAVAAVRMLALLRLNPVESQRSYEEVARLLEEALSAIGYGP